MQGDTESDSESEYTRGAQSDLALAVDALCMLSSGPPRVDSCAAPAKPVQVSERERRKNLELVRVFEKSKAQGLLRRRGGERADKRAHERADASKGEGSDIGLSKCQNVKMSKCQNVKMSVVCGFMSKSKL